jgi:outer membrane receptor protein involved in Fe transport
MKRHHKISRFIFALTALFALAVKAENLSTSLIEVVSPTPLPSLGIPLNQVPSNVQIGSAKEISQQGSLNLSDFLDSNLGSINTSGSVGNPYQNDVSYRGFNASPILGNPIGLSVYLDGVRFNEPFGDIVNWDLIPMNAISAINLMPGSNPLFGLNTLGGSLSVNTKNGADDLGLKASLMGGSWGRRAFEFEAGGVNKEKNIDYFVAGNIFHEDGWRDHSSSDVRQLFSKVRWHGEKSNLDLSVALADNEMEGTQALPMSMMSAPEKPYTYPDSIKNQMVMINLKGDHLIGETKLLAGNVYYRRNQMKSFNSNAQFSDACLNGLLGSFSHCHATNGTDDVTGGVAPNDYTGIDAQNVLSKTIQNGYGGSMQLTLLGDVLSHKNQATVGASADLSSIRFNQNGYLANLINYETVTDPSLTLQTEVGLKAKTYYYGIYGTDNFALNEQVNITLSGRYNVAFIDMKGSNSDFTTNTISSLDGNHRYSRFNPAVGLNYNPSSQLGFYGGYNEGMRAPTPIELACANKDIPCSLPTGFNSDPDLKKVVSKTWEGGVRGKLSDKIRWNASVYQSDMTNDIQFITANVSGRGYFDNVGDARRRGVELGAQAKLDGLTLVANYGFVDATYESNFIINSVANSSSSADLATAGTINVNKGNRMPGIARQTLKLRGVYDLTPTWNVGTHVIVAAGQFAQGDQNNQDSHGKIPGYAVVNLDSRYSVTNQWSIFAKVNNLFDKDYSTFGTLGQNIYSSDPNEQFRTPAAPRAGWLGISYSFGGSNKQGSVDKD